jgi:phage shock protein PspC (stress-responsive transcriptional regulator)
VILSTGPGVASELELDSTALRILKLLLLLFLLLLLMMMMLTARD